MSSSQETRLARAIAEFRGIPGLRSIGSGFKSVNGERSQTPALCLFVAKKLPRYEVRRAHRFPEFFEGVPIDVYERYATQPIATARFKPPAAQDKKVSTVVGGVEIADEGTLGCIAKINQQVVVLTAGHLFMETGGILETPIEVGSPKISCCCCCKSGVIGKLVKAQVDNHVDCAAVALNANQPWVQRIPNLGPDKNHANDDLIFGAAPLRTDPTTQIQSPVLIGEHVRKVGISTGLTGGEVAFLNEDVPGSDELPPLLKPQIMIKPLQDEGFRGKTDQNNIHFSLHGDSGAAVIDDNNKVVGILVRRANFNDPPDWQGGGGVAIDIHKVMAALGVTAIPESKVTKPTTTAGAVLPGSAVHRLPQPGSLEHTQRAAVESLKAALQGFALGRRLVDFVERHAAEILGLVNSERKVTVTWHRAHGPGYVALLARDLVSLDESLPPGCGGTRPETMLSAMREVLTSTASEELVSEMNALWPAVERAVPASHTLRALVDNLRAVPGHV